MNLFFEIFDAELFLRELLSIQQCPLSVTDAPVVNRFILYKVITAFAQHFSWNEICLNFFSDRYQKLDSCRLDVIRIPSHARGRCCFLRSQKYASHS